MKEKISKTLSKISSDTPTANSATTSASRATASVAPTLGDPNCPYCAGVGYVRFDVPMGDPKFGRLEACVCRASDIAAGARNRLFEMSRLDQLSHLTFENFDARGNKNAKFMTPQDATSLQAAREAAENFARNPQSWLLIEGGYGCGKTHIAAAIANFAVAMGRPTLFITVPDLLDTLRFAYSDPETTFEARFEEVRGADLLVLDDFGTQNATGWAQEKLFQIMNYRYINKLPTVITTNLMLDEIESRIRSRLQDEEFVAHVRITAPDYRRPKETSNPGLSILSKPDIQQMTFKTFIARDYEVGTEVQTVVITEVQSGFGKKYQEKKVTRVEVTKSDVRTLENAVKAAIEFAEEPNGWLVFLGHPGCGKTHLAAAIGNHRIDLGGQAILVEVIDLLDYLRQTFSPKSDVSFDRRFYEIKNTPMLILDDIKESGSSSIWAEDKLHQILYHRYYSNLPTVLTSTLKGDQFATNYPSLWFKILDTDKCRVQVIDMPPYLPHAKGVRGGHRKGK